MQVHAPRAAPVAPAPLALPEPEFRPGPSAPRRDVWSVLDEADRIAVALQHGIDRIALPIARTARRFVDRRGWQDAGFARIEDFGVEAFQRSGRWLRDMAALDRSLERFPELRRALTGDDGGAPLGAVKATAIGRFLRAAQPPRRRRGLQTLSREEEGTEQRLAAWVRFARRSSVPELRAAIRAARASEPPEPPGAAPVAVEAAATRRRLCRLEVPPAVRAAFEETLDLHRAVVGSAVAPAGDLIEALAAENAAAGLAPGEEPPAPVRPSASPERDRELARRRAALPTAAACIESAGRILPELRRLAELERGAYPDSSRRLARRLVALIRLGEELHVRLGQLLAELSLCRGWSHFGFRDLGHYAEERLGISAARAERRARLARRLLFHPEVREAYEHGRLGLESARLVVQALGGGEASSEAGNAWVREAQRVTVKRLRDNVWLRNRFPLPRRDTPSAFPPEDAAWQASLRRDPGRTRSRVRELGEAALADRSASDALRLWLTADQEAMLRGALRGRRAALEEEARGIRTPGDDERSSLRIAESFSTGARRLPDWVALLALLEDYAETWDDPAGFPRRSEDRVYRRDGWRCMAPACTARRNLEAHHIRYRSQGGTDDTANLVTLCRFHHQEGEHGGRLRVTGEAPLGLTFRIGRFDPTQRFRNERRLRPAALHGHGPAGYDERNLPR